MIQEKPSISPLFLAIVALMGLGLVQVYSASFVFASDSYGNGLFFFERQLAFVALAMGVLFATSLAPLAWIEKWGWLLWAFAALGIAATFLPGVGVRVGGAARWLDLPGSVRFEPSELLKFSFCLLFATYLTRHESILARVKPGYLAIFF